ncbi:MAG: fumarylacetoacetate hydrolase family protein [Desulfosarcinaceae bacterium]|nr:fumarylacetoacetate hydrolase family protein [Desulfosarcinaceae bacterium]
MISLPVAGQAGPHIVSPSKIIALGLNYREHIAESESVSVQGFTQEIPSEPVLFAKTPNVLIGPEMPIVIPKFLAAYGFDTIRVDYEAELALIIGKRCKEVPAEAALDHILGFTCMNDVSQRNLQNSDRSGWFRGKSLDTFGPIGPRIVPPAAIGDVQNLDIICRLNGEIVQSGNTAQMIFPVNEIVHFISRNFTLFPGDIILTGTPSGVGPLSPGDVVEVEIERIGTLRNSVMAEP